jgi:hypothetical protein
MARPPVIVPITVWWEHLARATKGVLFGAAVLALVGCGQVNRGVLTGHLHLRGNVPHALSSGARVVVAEGNTVVAYQYTHNDGMFRFSLPPGSYAMSVAAPTTTTSVVAVRTGATTVEDLNVTF